MTIIIRVFFLYISFSSCPKGLLLLSIGAMKKIMIDAGIRINVKVMNPKDNLCMIPKLKKAINTEKK